MLENSGPGLATGAHAVAANASAPQPVQPRAFSSSVVFPTGGTIMRPSGAAVESSEEAFHDLPEWAQMRLSALEETNRQLTSQLAKAQHLAQHDDISGLPNHRAATSMLARTVRRHSRSGKPFAVLFVDGDNLRLYNNDGYGAGNRMISCLAVTLVDGLRPTDYVARWLSGDEFIAILPDAGTRDAVVAADRLRAQVEATFRSATIPVTVSIGVAVFPDDGADGSTLVDRAVEANSLAKSAGKNRVALATRGPSSRKS